MRQRVCGKRQKWRARVTGHPTFLRGAMSAVNAGWLFMSFTANIRAAAIRDRRAVSASLPFISHSSFIHSPRMRPVVNPLLESMQCCSDAVIPLVETNQGQVPTSIIYANRKTTGKRVKDRHQWSVRLLKITPQHHHRGAPGSGVKDQFPPLLRHFLRRWLLAARGLALPAAAVGAPLLPMVSTARLTPFPSCVPRPTLQRQS